ncbi:hypothetical protein PsorP6_015016 [Peronosclerospora sorghi]|uniref:Uncharacterized protein n=1 Tax=Peronosclerospora sorghi TaxID=230839 RepID=A0ACC0VRK9_9STRA|nr:hypothetical protein PsorP6_015016 [Peronosclerospora sorghi]
MSPRSPKTDNHDGVDSEVVRRIRNDECFRSDEILEFVMTSAEDANEGKWRQLERAAYKQIKSYIDP